ncbi:Fic family protein [Sporolactobacillus shoreae]|uniref:Fic family protein n=1 Tax=Sporolactobacillus shoreae TaxID=1465501 RepID=A0A4Z0GJX5_9BACL|nr:Fic family protein [Sporolactobacillus shoreae]TGA96346.1 Fic family protein [Sporolactobacillus shoreae]
MLNFPDDYLKDVLVRLAHHSTAIEGNTLSLAETISIILDSALPPTNHKVNLREINEVKNHEPAFHYILDELNADHPLTINTVKKIHAALTDRLQHDHGQFKSTDNAILGSEFHTASATQTPFLMQQWVDNLNFRLASAANDTDCYMVIGEAHIAFERIHPFSDGNGRTGRMLLTYFLLQQNLPPAVISSADRTEYISFLAKEDGQGLSRFIQNESKDELNRIWRFQNQEKQQIKMSPAVKHSFDRS